MGDEESFLRWAGSEVVKDPPSVRPTRPRKGQSVEARELRHTHTRI